MEWYIYKRLVLLLFVFCAIALNGQEIPPIRNFSPADFGAENQNWAISQAEDKLIYMANNKGLLAYNGSQWTLYPSPNETIIRSVEVAGNRIYMGSYKEFGYWVKNEFGTLDYTSLSNKIINELLEDEEFWSIAHLEGRVLFQSKKRLYIYNLAQGTFDILDSETSLPRIFNTDQGVFVQSMGQGLFQIIGGTKQLVNGDTPLKEDEIINIFSSKEGLLVLTRHQGFYSIEGDVLNKWNVGADATLLESSIYSAIQLADKRFALGTISNGFLLLDQKGDLQYHIDQIKGLRNNTVLSVYEDMDSNIWLGLDNGISYINPSSAYKVYTDYRGAIGSVYASARSKNNLYLGTNQGLYYKKIQDTSGFELIPGTQGQVWFLDSIDGTLFCGHHTGTFVVSDNKVSKIANIPGTWKIGRLDGHDKLLLQGNYQGLYVLENQDGVWNVRNKIDGFNNSSRYFEVLGNDIFVNHEYKGVFMLNVDNTFSKVLQVSIDSLTPGFNSGIAKFKGKLLYAHKSGVLKYDSEGQEFQMDSTLSKVYTEDSYISGKMVVDEKNDNLWFFSNDDVSRVSTGKLNDNVVIENYPLNENSREGIVGYESISLLEDNTYLLGANMGYLVFDLTKFQEKNFEVQIGSINQLSKNQLGHLGDYIKNVGEGDFSHDQNNLGITFYTASYDRYTIPKYQFQLSEIYPNWSEWSVEPSVAFENLPPGEYTFNVRSKVGNKTSTNVASYSFKIRKPWHSSNTALFLYILLGVLVSFLINGAYKRYYRKRQQKLIAQNQRKMELAKAQNEKEIIKIKNEQLQQEFRSKSNELAASTLSIIRKNELLTKVKQELMSNAERREFINPIITIIDNNLNKNDDWELFKEAFNNADRKFLKKLKKAHPKLTPNDIRLCAYLRLNLSSKEIAPLLNISPRSVEIKRYRLRKKMNLSHDDNLTNYILKL